MLKEQCPDFHMHKDWDRFAARWLNKRSERDKGSDILGLIKSAMDTLASARPSKRNPPSDSPV
jgi:hypothetical protein